MSTLRLDGIFEAGYLSPGGNPSSVAHRNGGRLVVCVTYITFLCYILSYRFRLNISSRVPILQHICMACMLPYLRRLTLNYAGMSQGHLCMFDEPLYPVEKIEWCLYALFMNDLLKIDLNCKFTAMV